MVRFIFRRLLTAIPVLLGIVVVVFFLARVIPGDACIAALGERASDEVCAEWEERVGLDKPLPVQLARYMGDVLTGDLGESVSLRRPVSELLVERLPTTLELAIAAMIVATFLGIPLGIWAAYRHNSASDVGVMIGANIGVSMPVFWLGLMLQFVFAVLLKDTFLALPASGRLDPGVIAPPFYETWGISGNGLFEFISNMEVVNALLQLRWDILWDALRHLILPALALGTIPLAIIARMTRSSLLDVLGQDYVRTARAKGLAERPVVMKHAMRNAMLPVTTVVGLSLGTLLGGAILTETIFNLTGVGKTLYDAITARDYTVVQGFTLVIAVVFVLVNLVTDIVYTFLDPADPCDVIPERAPEGTEIPAELRDEPGHFHEVVPTPRADRVGVVMSARSRGLWRDAFRETFRKSSARVGAIVLLFLVLLALFAPVIAPFHPNEVLLGEGVRPRDPPCVHLFGCSEDKPQHILGTDGNGRDFFSRVVYGARISLLAGLAAVTFSLIVGTAIGLVAGYYGRWVDNSMMRVMDVLLAFPALLLAIVIVTVMGKGLFNAVVAISIVSIPIYARVVRASVLTVREQEFVAADLALGASHRRVLWHRILPNCLTPLVVQGTLGVATAVLEIAALSFLGLGIQPPTAEWGSMLAAERNQVFTSPHLVVAPGLLIMLNVLAFNLIGDGFRDALDPRLNR